MKNIGNPNRPSGGLVNTPQHLMDEGPPREAPPPEIVPSSGSEDPHPPDEGHPYAARHPGGANPPSPMHDIGPNDAVNTGSAPVRPRARRRDLP